VTSRRHFLHRAGLAAGGLLVAPLGVSCAGVPFVDASEAAGDRVFLGLFPSSTLTAPEDAIHRTLEKVDFSWLRPGDSVFVKVASNSANAHPATTSPVAVSAMVRALKDRGAGRVVVGDQAGTMSVRLAPGDVRWRSTKGVMESNGLAQAIAAAGAEAHYFDDGGFNDGYVAATLPANSTSWREQPFIARITTEVDHIVYLPRLSSHVLTGYTHGHKISVGFMRDDTRHHMHKDAVDIYEKYTELNHCREIASRLRLVVTYASEVLLDGGPDGGLIGVADPRIVIASSHLANHDAVAVAMLTWAQQNLGRDRNTGGLPFGPWASATNLAFLGIVELQTGIPWTSSGSSLPTTYPSHDFGAGIAADRALTRAYELLGGVPRAIGVGLAGAAPVESLRAHLVRTALA